jgi:hypothetical protein
MSKDLMHVDLTPIKTFRYNEISNYKFQFFLLGENYQALHTPFDCKDYFHEIFFTEYTGRSIEVYGMEWQPGTLNMENDTFLMALSGGSVQLEGYAKSFQKFLNSFDNALRFKPTKVHLTDNPLIIVLEFSKEWTVGGPLLSAYTTAIRLAALYEKGDALEYLKKIHEYKDDEKRPAGFPKFMGKEIARLDITLRRLAAILQGQKPECFWKEYKDTSNTTRYVHDLGIVNYQKFPSVDVD